MKFKLIDDWKAAHKFASVQLAAIAAALAAIMAANPSLLLGLVGMLPQGPLRILASAAIGLVVFVLPAIARVVQKVPKQ